MNNPMMIVGLVISIAAIVGLAIFTGMRKKANGGKIGFGVVAGLILGTLVGGSSTVGTAQLAFNYGMSAWWFTLGAGLGCLILALVYAKRLRAENSPTLVGMVKNEYGNKAGMAATILNSVGTFINILSQLIAASSVVLVVMPTMGTAWTIIRSLHNLDVVHSKDAVSLRSPFSDANACAARIDHVDNVVERHSETCVNAES